VRWLKVFPSNKAGRQKAAYRKYTAALSIKAYSPIFQSILSLILTSEVGTHHIKLNRTGYV
jgi:hypothetical protein